MSEILSRLDGNVLTLSYNRPEKLNAVTQPMIRLLREALREATVDPDVHVVVLAGEGASFSAGADVSAINGTDLDDPVTRRSHKRPDWQGIEQRADRIRRNTEIPLLLRTMPKPTIAALRGHAVGASLSAALACDFRLASQTLVMRTGFSGIGISGDHGMAHSLLLATGPLRAREIMYLNEKIDAEKALAYGLVNSVHADDALEAEVTALASRLAAGPRLAYRYIKENLYQAETATFEDFLRDESQRQARALNSSDAREAMAAFLEKRKPRFTGS